MNSKAESGGERKRKEALQHTGHMKFLVLHPGTEPVKYTDKQQTDKQTNK